MECSRTDIDDRVSAGWGYLRIAFLYPSIDVGFARLLAVVARIAPPVVYSDHHVLDSLVERPDLRFKSDQPVAVQKRLYSGNNLIVESPEDLSALKA